MLLHGFVVPSMGLSANERENPILKLKKLKRSSGASSLGRIGSEDAAGEYRISPEVIRLVASSPFVRAGFKIKLLMR